MSPEQRARRAIDRLHAEAGWAVQGRAAHNLGAGRGVAVREFAVAAGAADCLVSVGRPFAGLRLGVFHLDPRGAMR